MANRKEDTLSQREVEFAAEIVTEIVAGVEFNPLPGNPITCLIYQVILVSYVGEGEEVEAPVEIELAGELAFNSSSSLLQGFNFLKNIDCLISLLELTQPNLTS